MALLTKGIGRVVRPKGGGMGLPGGNRRFSLAAKSFAVAMTLVATVAQFFALSHEMTVRHFRCAEHGELTHVAATSGEYLLPIWRPTDALRRGEADAPDAHEHCAAAFTIQGGSSSPIVVVAARLAPPPQDRRLPVLPPARGRAFVLASAPKTSPPPLWS
jgi:hypothetical protein